MTGAGAGHETTGAGAGHEITGAGAGHEITGAGTGHEITGAGAGHEITGHGAGHATGHGAGQHGLLNATPNPTPPKPQHLLRCLANASELNPATINKSNANMMKTGYLVLLLIIYLPPLI